jgi:hypothetical protein
MVLINTVVSDGIYNIIYNVYAQWDGNHQTEGTFRLTVKSEFCHLVFPVFTAFKELYSAVLLNLEQYLSHH